MVRTGVDSALNQLSEIELYHRTLDCRVRHLLFSETRSLCRKLHLGVLGWECGPYERISEIDEYRKESYKQAQSYKRELMFFNMIISCFATTDPNLGTPRAPLRAIWNDFEERIDDLCKAEPGKRDWGLLTSLLEGYFSSPLPSHQTLEFLQDVFQNLEVLVSYRANAISSVKIQFDSLKLRVNLSRKFFQLITAHGGINCEELRELEVYLHSFANNAACLAFLFWAKHVNDEIRFEAKVKKLFSDMWQKICKSCGSDGIPLYLGGLKAIKLHPSDDTLLHGEVVTGFVDLHMDYLVAALKMDWLIVRDGLIFLLSFMTNPPEGCDQDDQLDSVCKQIDLVFNKCMYLIFSPYVIVKEHFTMDKMLFSDFVQNLEATMGKVRQLYVENLHSFSYNFPRTNGVGFYELLLQNLEILMEKLDSDTTFIPFAKKFVTKVGARLLSLRPLVTSIFELQKEQKEFEDTWLQVIHLAYRIEHVINSCYVGIHPIWYNMTSFPDVLDQIDHVKRKLEEVGVKRDIHMAKSYKMHYTGNTPRSLLSSSKPPERNWLAITSEQEAIGRVEEMRKITDELIGGYESLGIISVIGMGGLGKTGLVKEIYNSKIVTSHFHTRGFGSVSQVLNKRNFFVNILYGISNCGKEKLDSMTEDDLAHHLWRCLSGKTYLIVVDDIWDIEAWDTVKISFPDDKNKSRVIFTTREHKVALGAKSSLHNLRPLSNDESLKLLHLKVFGEEDCSPNLFEVEKIIAKNCKGLPLSIIVVAGLLASNQTSLSWWQEIAEATSRFVGEECKDIIGYSYKHLPEHLKSCFLYMGIYEEDELILTKQIRNLWIGEGLVEKSMTKSKRIMAKDYLKDLVDRNLVTAVWSSCGGEIKRCCLHDVIRDFCRRQVEQDNFLWLGDGYGASSSSNFIMRNQYRISIHRSFDDTEQAIVKNVHSLLCRGKKNPNVTKFVLQKLKLVQVLHLEGEAELSSDLVHLRYISIEHWHGKVLPESICNLWNLEILIIETTHSIIMLPKTIWKMKSLRHLQFQCGCVIDLDEEEDEGRQLLLENVEFFSTLYLYNDTSARAVLRRLPNIQRLSCVLVNSFFPNSSDWNSRVFTIDFLGKLESLSLESRVGTLQVFRFPSTLKRLVLEAKNGLTQHTLSIVGELPCLEVLKLYGSANQWDVEDGHFQKLKYLKVSLQYLEQWDVSFDSFSCLQRLDLWNAIHLEEIPARFAELSTLERIELELATKELERSAIQVQKEQMDNGNQVEIAIFSRSFDGTSSANEYTS